MLTKASDAIFRANLQDYVPIVELVFVHSRVKFRFFCIEGANQASIVSRLGGALGGGLLIFRAKYYAFFQLVWNLQALFS